MKTDSTKFTLVRKPGGRSLFAFGNATAFPPKPTIIQFDVNVGDATLMTSFKYDSDKVSLDRYTVVERDKLREVYNWLQYFSPESLKREVRTAGLEVETLFGDVAGNAYDAAGMEFAVVLKAT